MSADRPLILFFAALLAVGGCASLLPYDEARTTLGEGRFIELRHGPVHWVDRGSGPPVVLLHGFGSSAFSWRLVSAALTDAGYRTIAPDFYGFGLSARPHSKESYSRFSQGELVLELLDALDIERAHVAGHSYGGSVAMALAVREPDRFESLTLVDSAAIDYPQARRSIAAAARPVTTLFVRLRLSPHRVRRSLRRSAADDAVVTPQLVDAYYRRLAIAGVARAFWGLTAPLSDPQGRVEHSDVEIPTLAIWGAEDELITAENAQLAVAEMQQSGFVALPGVGHIPMEESPDELADLMVQFLDGGLAAFPESATEMSDGVVNTSRR